MNKIYDLFNRSVDWFTSLNIYEMWAIVTSVLLISCIIGLMIAEHMIRVHERRMRESRVCLNCLSEFENLPMFGMCPECGRKGFIIRKWRLK